MAFLGKCVDGNQVMLVGIAYVEFSQASEREYEYCLREEHGRSMLKIVRL